MDQQLRSRVLRLRARSGFLLRRRGRQLRNRRLTRSLGSYGRCILHNDRVGRSGTRCVREGVLPADAIYGAWFWIPEKIEPLANWNLMHFQDSEPGTPFQYRWDVSLGISDDGDLSLHVLEFPTREKFTPTVATTVPIGAWFHVEFRWLRADAPDGRVTLFQDGVPILDVTDIDASGFDFGQWHVGNLADDLEPANSTLYVDDVGIRRAP